MPYGIFHDELRIELIREHIQTNEKAVNQISELQSKDDKDYNLIIRWVNTKEHHANFIQEIASQYFPHQLVVYAMKSKQGLDLANNEKMQKALAAFEDACFGEHRHKLIGSHKQQSLSFRSAIRRREISLQLPCYSGDLYAPFCRSFETTNKVVVNCREHNSFGLNRKTKER